MLQNNWNIYTMKLPVLSKIIYKFNAIPTRIFIEFFQVILKVIWKNEQERI